MGYVIAARPRGGRWPCSTPAHRRRQRRHTQAVFRVNRVSMAPPWHWGKCAKSRRMACRVSGRNVRKPTVRTCLAANRRIWFWSFSPSPVLLGSTLPRKPVFGKLCLPSTWGYKCLHGRVRHSSRTLFGKVCLEGSMASHPPTVSATTCARRVTRSGVRPCSASPQRLPTAQTPQYVLAESRIPDSRRGRQPHHPGQTPRPPWAPGCYDDPAGLSPRPARGGADCAALGIKSISGMASSTSVAGRMGCQAPIPWTPNSAPSANWRGCRQTPYVFVTERKGPMTDSTFRKIVARAGARAQLGFPVHPHMLRHATGFKLANDGHATRAIQHYLGHKNIQYTVRYTELSAQRFTAFWPD